MAKKKTIPCRVCGKPFEPCSYCQSHADVFRWRNFACSIECAKKYVNDAIAYRETLKSKENETVNKDVFAEKPTTTRKKANKKSSIEIIEKETE